MRSDMKRYIYQFVGGPKAGLYQTLREALKYFTISGYSKNLSKERAMGGIVHREELDDQPEFHDYLGPMWGGTTEDGKAILRYETQEVYDLLSV